MPGIRKPNLWNSKVGYHIPREHDPDYDSDHDRIRYCQSCLEVGIRSELKRRLYRVEDSKLVAETVPAPDADCFRQCYRCGDIVPIFNVKQESTLVDFVELTLNPFDDNADSMGSLDRATNLRRKNKSKYKRKKAQLSAIKDDDLRREMSDGQTELVNYFEQK